MSNSFKNLQNKLAKLKEELTPNEPKRRVEALSYLRVLTELINASYIKESTSDYMLLRHYLIQLMKLSILVGLINTQKKSYV